MIETGFYGPQIDIVAPGAQMAVARSLDKSRFNDEQTYTIDLSGTGTSYATAFVAGACALWQAHWGREQLLQRYTVDDVEGNPTAYRLVDAFREVLIASCDKSKPPWNNPPADPRAMLYGHGVLDVRALLTAALPPP